MQSTGRLVSLYRLLKIARPVVNVIKLICPLFTDFRTKLEFVRLGKKKLPRTDTLAYYENP